MSITFNGTTENIDFVFNKDGIKLFLRRFMDLIKVGETIKLRIDRNSVLLYAAVGKQQIIAFKSAVSDVSDLVTDVEDLPNGYMDFVFINPANFVNNTGFYLADDMDVMCRMKRRVGSSYAQELQMTNGKISHVFLCGDASELPSKVRELSIEQIESKMDPANCNFSFEVDKEVLDRVRRLCKNNKDTEIVNIYVKSGSVKIGTHKWKVDAGKVEDVSDTKLTFAKKYLYCVEPADAVKFNVFEEFVLIKEGETRLMIGLELDDVK